MRLIRPLSDFKLALFSEGGMFWHGRKRWIDGLQAAIILKFNSSVMSKRAYASPSLIQARSLTGDVQVFLPLDRNMLQTYRL